MDKIQKDQKKPTATSEEPEQKQGTAHAPLHTAPPKGWAEHLSHPSGPIPGHTPTLTPYEESARPPFREQARESVACSCSLWLQQGPQ